MQADDERLLRFRREVSNNTVTGGVVSQLYRQLLPVLGDLAMWGRRPHQRTRLPPLSALGKIPSGLVVFLGVDVQTVRHSRDEELAKPNQSTAGYSYLNKPKIVRVGEFPF